MHQVSLFIFTSCIINAEITINGYSYFFFSFHLHSFALGGVVVVVVVVVVIIVVPPSMLAAGGKFMGNIRFSAELTKKKFFLNYRPMMSANFKFPFHLLVLLLGLRLPPSLPTSTSAFTPTRLYYNIIHQLIQSFTPPYTLGQFHSYLFLVVSAQHQESSNPVGPS